MAEELVREIRKFEKRLNDLIEVGEETIEALKTLREVVDKSLKLSELVSRSEMTREQVESMLKLKIEIIEGMNNIFDEIHRSEHAKSHFIENVITLISMLEKCTREALEKVLAAK